MDVYGYGEDSLTLWAFQNRLSAILSQLHDDSSPADCSLFFRPSFGRRGGVNSAQFGEFDFILLTGSGLYLGEAKWDRSPEKSSSSDIVLRPEQILRHNVFRQYVIEWTSETYFTWDAFLSAAESALPGDKPMAPLGSLLSENLQKVLQTIQSKFQGTPSIVDVLLYLYDGTTSDPLPTGASEGFRLVCVDFSEAKFDNYIRM